MSYLLNFTEIQNIAKTSKAPVRAASIGANIPLASPLASLDGVTLNPGDRVLLKDQSTPSQNGIYDLDGSNNLSRSPDFVTTKVFEGNLIAVSGGAVNPNSLWMITSNNPILVGTDPITIVQTSGGGGGSATSNYGKTVFVSQGHERATDTRTGLDLYDMENPFATIGAAMADIFGEGATEVTVVVAAGTYLENVNMHPTLRVVGDGNKTVISRITCVQAGNFLIENLKIENDAATSPAPNSAGISISSTASVVLKNCYVSQIKDSEFNESGAISITDGSLEAHNCFIRQYSDHASAAATSYGAIKINTTASCTVKLFDTVLEAETNCAGQTLGVITHISTTTGTILLQGCSLSCQQLNGAATSPRFGLVFGDTSNISVEANACKFFIKSFSPSVNFICFIARGVGSKYQVSNCHLDIAYGGTPYISEDNHATTSIRLRNLTYNTSTTLPGRFGSPTASFFHSGVLANGTEFPDQSSQYGATVFVAMGHERATDTRTGLSRFDAESPFETLGAALSAVDLAGDTYVTVHIYEGYYNEDVEVPDTITLKCNSENVFITRVQFTNGGGNTWIGGSIYNNATDGSVAPNTSPILVSNSTSLRMMNVNCEGYTTNTTGVVDPTISIDNASVSAENCTFGHNHLGGGTGSGVTRICVRAYGANSTFIARDCSFFVFTTTQTDHTQAISFESSTSTALLRLIDCQTVAFLSHASATGNIQVVNVATTTTPSKVQIYGGNIGFQSPIGSTPGQQILIYLNSTGIAQEVYVAGITVRELIGSASNRYAAAAIVATNVVRLINTSWSHDTPQLPAFSPQSGSVVQSGALSDGTYFPGGGGGSSTSEYAKTVFVSQGHERATDVRGGLSLYDMENPFETVQAACTAIETAVAQDVLLFIEAGSYDEIVTTPDALRITIQGRKERSVITQILVPSGTATLRDLALVSSMSASVANNEAALKISGTGSVIADNISVTTTKDSFFAGDIYSLYVIGDTSQLTIRNSQVRLIADTEDAAGSFAGAIGKSGDSSTPIIIDNCDLSISINNDAQNFSVVSSDMADGSPLFRITNSYLEAVCLDAASTAIMGVISNENGGRPSLILDNSTLKVEAAGSSMDIVGFVGRGSNGPLVWKISNCVWHINNANSTVYIAEDEDIATDTRIYNLIHHGTITYIPTRYNTPTGTFAYDGILPNGDRFPIKRIYIPLAANHSVNGLTMSLFTGELKGFDATPYTQALVYDIRFCVCLYQSSTPLTANAHLYDVSNGNIVTGTNVNLTGVGSTTPTIYKSGAQIIAGGSLGDLQDSDTIYEVRISTNGTLVGDSTTLGAAWLEINSFS